MSAASAYDHDAALFDAAHDDAQFADQHGLLYYSPTKPQLAFLEDPRPIVLWRDGNQLGKTTAVIADLIHRCRGTHPWQRTRRPPINALVISVSHEQMGQAGGFHEKLWTLLPKDEIDLRNEYDPGRGIRGKPPRIVFTSGPGKGSVIGFATYEQGAKRVAGGTVHVVVLDEPPTESMYTEVMPRLLKHGGQLRISMTPTLDMPDVRWLRRLVEGTENERPSVYEHNFGLREENCWPANKAFPWLTQRRIDDWAMTLPAVQRRMRLEGAWEPVLTGAYLSNYCDDNERWFRPPKGAYLVGGIDHGATKRKQAFMLAAFADRHGAQPRAWFWREHTSDGYTTPEMDAENILKTLKSVGLTYWDIDEWVGDRSTGENKYLVGKSNKELRLQFARLLGVDVDKTKYIYTPTKFDGSVDQGLHMLNAMFGRRDADGRPHAVVHPSCKRFREFCRRFIGDRRDPLKDIGDAGRYAAERAVRPGPWMALRAVY